MRGIRRHIDVRNPAPAPPPHVFVEDLGAQQNIKQTISVEDEHHFGKIEFTLDNIDQRAKEANHNGDPRPRHFKQETHGKG